MKVTIYHNSNCSKSCAALKIVNDAEIAADVVHYLDTPPSPSELAQILEMLGKRPVDIIRFGEPIAKELELTATDERSDDEWLQLMVNHPILIQRPIVVADGKAVIGRPTENVHNLLGLQ